MAATLTIDFVAHPSKRDCGRPHGSAGHQHARGRPPAPRRPAAMGARTREPRLARAGPTRRTLIHGGRTRMGGAALYRTVRAADARGAARRGTRRSRGSRSAQTIPMESQPHVPADRPAGTPHADTVHRMILGYRLSQALSVAAALGIAGTSETHCQRAGPYTGCSGPLSSSVRSVPSGRTE
jgi:hypothetical protein